MKNTQKIAALKAQLKRLETPRETKQNYSVTIRPSVHARICELFGSLPKAQEGLLELWNESEVLRSKLREMADRCELMEKELKYLHETI